MLAVELRGAGWMFSFLRRYVNSRSAPGRENDASGENVGSKEYFPTQTFVDSITTITDADRKVGAPLDPVPAAFLRCPAPLNICQPPASDEEAEAALEIRRGFFIDNYAEPYILDIVRSFRLLRGMRTYIEIGTFDRGNLAYVSSILADDAIIIGLDIQAEEARDARLKSVLKRGQKYVSVVGDSRDEDVVRRVKAALDGRPVDAVFIDGNHTAHAVMCDYVNFGELVRKGGAVLFHDSLWEGTSQWKGTADALAEIDKLEPIYLVPGQLPCRRFMRVLWRDAIWGVVAVRLVD